MIKRLLILFSIVLSVVVVKAQQSFIFLPELQGRTTDGLLQVRIVNSATESRQTRLRVTVTEQAGGRVLTLLTAPFQLMPGTNGLPPAIGRQTAISFGNNKTAAICRQSGVFPEGEYEYCFQLEDAGKDGEPGDEQCFDYYLQPFAPLMLITPSDEEKICDKRPSLFWQPQLPAIPGVAYRVTLVEVKPHQPKTEALNYNTPLINQMGIRTSMLFYPPHVPELQEGKTYAWQVTAYQQQMLLSNSEIWEFTVACDDEPNEPPVTGFRDLADLSKGNFYIANGRISFALRNQYEAGELDYTIKCLTQPDQQIRKLPRVKLLRGNNQIVIDLDEKYGFVDGSFYIMTVVLPNKEQKQLRFIYKKDL
jgi:hypothetical protein